MTRKNDKNELMEFLDSFDIDDDYNNALSDKMEVFTQEKKKREEEKEVKIAQPVEQKKEPIRVGNTIVAPLKAGETSDAGGKTVVFSKDAPPLPKAGGETVVINGSHIQNFMDEGDDTEELLRREVIQEFNDQPMMSIEIRRILYVVAGILVSFALIFGGYKVITNLANLGQPDEAELLRNEYFEELKAWAENYDQLSDAEKGKIQTLEVKFNKLTDDQKEEINNILREKSGHTFDELLAKSKSDAKEKTNNNTELAEAKAKLKAEMEEMKLYMDAAKEALDEAEDTMKQAEEDYNVAQELMDIGQEEVKAALDALNEIETDGGDPEVIKEKYESVEKWREARDAAKQNYNEKVKEYDFNSLQINLNNAYYAYNVATQDYNQAQSDYNYYEQQYRDLQSQYKELDKN